jgi:TolB protein
MVPFRKIAPLIAVLFLCFFIIAAGVYILNYWLSYTQVSGSSELIFPTRSAVSVTTLTSTPDFEGAVSTPISGPQGKIVYVCQIFKLQAQDQICIINADGTGQYRLTTQDSARFFYPSFAPDGKSVVFSSNLDGDFKLYEMTLDGLLTPIGDTVGFAPEVSPDNLHIAFVNNNGQHDMIWVADRDGANPILIFTDAWDPTWSPDGRRILFATTVGDRPQLASVNLDGSDFRPITNLPDLRGRSDWSDEGTHVVTYSGKAWQRELYIMDPDGSNLRQITPSGGNSQGPSFSPDGQWVAFTAYFDAIGNNNGCEIYIMRIDGTNLKRLTNNNYCDWQPRWGRSNH